jgi:hypothetical protein
MSINSHEKHRPNCRSHTVQLLEGVTDWSREDLKNSLTLLTK